MCGETLTIDQLRENDTDACKAIWLACFADDLPKVPEMFFRDILRPEEGLVWRVDGKPVSMVLTLPANLVCNGRRWQIQYIYAAATHPAYQHRGIFSQLLSAALERGRRQGMTASFLRPGEPSLADYYARFGYRPFFTARREEVEEVWVSGDDVPRLADWTPIAANAYASLRRKWLLQHTKGFVDWPDRLIGCAVALDEMDGGGAFGDRQGHGALCVPRDGFLLVRELLCSTRQQREVCRSLLQRLAFDRAEMWLPAETDGEMFGLWCPLSAAGETLLKTACGAYMGIALE